MGICRGMEFVINYISLGIDCVNGCCKVAFVLRDLLLSLFELNFVVISLGILIC